MNISNSRFYYKTLFGSLKNYSTSNMQISVKDGIFDSNYSGNISGRIGIVV